jgi:transcriptional regulator with XRE-family HTH domain
MPKTVDERVTGAIGAEIRRLRKARGWGLRRLAAEADVEFGRVGKIERGDGAGVDTYRRLAEALGVSLAALFSVLDHRRARRQGARSVPVHAATVPYSPR